MEQCCCGELQRCARPYVHWPRVGEGIQTCANPPTALLNKHACLATFLNEYISIHEASNKLHLHCYFHGVRLGFCLNNPRS